MSVTYEEIKEEFEYSLGYIHNDIQALCQGKQTLNYTVALLVGVACEALEDAGAYTNKICPRGLIAGRGLEKAGETALRGAAARSGT